MCVLLERMGGLVKLDRASRCVESVTDNARIGCERRDGPEEG